MDRVDFRGSEFVLARAVALRGFGGRRAGELLVIDALGGLQGSLFGGVADNEILEGSLKLRRSGESFDLITVGVGDRDAVRVGLACGGEADVLLSKGSSLPQGFTEKVTSRQPVALATVVAGPHRGRVLAANPDKTVSGLSGSLSDDFFSKNLGERLLSALANRTPAAAIVNLDDDVVYIEVFSPPTHMVIVGESDLAQAILSQGQLLGWSGIVLDDLDDSGQQVRNLGTNDALIVLSHNHGVGIPLITDVLRSGLSTYVGGLGSRHTQQTRSAILSEIGFSDNEIGRIYGPVGLDLGSRTPEETALAICAEILAHVSGRNARSLKLSSGPING